MSLSLEASQALQNALTNHVRDPENEPAPDGIEDRRLRIYRDLLYNNIEGFVSRAFPICRQLFSDASWHAMVRNFMHHHGCSTPYFTEIAQEFIVYLQGERLHQESEPAFLLELAHYEWVEIAIDLAEHDIATIDVKRSGNLLDEKPLVSPLAMSLAYQFPVHKIGLGYQPEQPPEQPSYLIVYRNREDQVKFMEANAITAQLLALLSEPATTSGRAALEQIARDMQHPDPTELIANGQITMDKLRRLDIILGTETC